MTTPTVTETHTCCTANCRDLVLYGDESCPVCRRTAGCKACGS